MKTFAAVAILLSLVIFSSCEPLKRYQAKSDFAQLCRITRDFRGGKNQDLFVFNDQVHRKLQSSYFQSTWAAVIAAPAKDRYSLLVQGARDVGLENYYCYEIQPLLEK